MKIGIIGPPQSGKTTIFKILLNKDISGNIGVFKLQDYRIEKISEAFSSKKRSCPEFTFVDIGTISSFSRKDFSNLEDIDLFICTIGAFFSEDPKKDFESSLTDIILSDLEIIQNRIAKLQKEKSKIDREKENKLLEKCQALLSEGKLLWKADLSKDEARLFSGLPFLTMKPIVVAINVPENDKDDKVKELEKCCRSKGISFIRFFGKIELELMELEEQDREKFLKEMGPGYNLRERASKLISKELSLITFFTAREKETRGWHLKSGLPAVEAAGKIHADMKRGFIRAEVVNYEDFIKCRSIHKAREEGLLKVEGKEYIVKEGDILNIRFNV